MFKFIIKNIKDILPIIIVMEDNEPDIESIQNALRYLKAVVQNPNEEYSNICK